MAAGRHFKVILRAVDDDRQAALQAKIADLFDVEDDVARSIVSAAPIVILAGIALGQVRPLRERLRPLRERGATLVFSDQRSVDFPEVNWPSRPQIARIEGEEGEAVDPHGIACPSCGASLRLVSERAGRSSSGSHLLSGSSRFSADEVEEKKAAAASPSAEEVEEPPEEVEEPSEEAPVAAGTPDIREAETDAERPVPPILDDPLLRAREAEEREAAESDPEPEPEPEVEVEPEVEPEPEAEPEPTAEDPGDVPDEVAVGLPDDARLAETQVDEAAAERKETASLDTDAIRAAVDEDDPRADGEVEEADDEIPLDLDIDEAIERSAGEPPAGDPTGEALEIDLEDPGEPAAREADASLDPGEEEGVIDLEVPALDDAGDGEGEERPFDVSDALDLLAEVDEITESSVESMARLRREGDDDLSPLEADEALEIFQSLRPGAEEEAGEEVPFETVDEGAASDSELQPLDPMEALALLESQSGGMRRPGSGESGDREIPATDQERPVADAEALEEGDGDEGEDVEDVHGLVLPKITTAAKRRKAAEIISEIKGISPEEAMRLTDRTIIPVLKGVSRDEAEAHLERFRSSKISARVTTRKVSRTSE